MRGNVDDGDGWEGRLHEVSARALYLHVPFCARKCPYCDFASWETSPRDAIIGGYVTSLSRLMRQVREVGLLEGVETAYVGGGTPTLLGSSLGELVSAVFEVCDPDELTSEANPDSLTQDVLDSLVDAGATRISLGVQSLRDGELSALGRIHDARGASGALERAIASGLDVSCDLMCAIPGQTDESWGMTLAEVIYSGVGHVSVYPLMIEDGTPFATRVDEGTMREPTDDVEARRMEQAEHALVSAGLERYEVASYARPGCECRHNEAYWTGMPYLGIGTSASGMLPAEAYGRLRAIAPRLPAASPSTARVRMTCLSSPQLVAAGHAMSDLSFDIEFLDERQAAAEDLMLTARMSKGIPPGLLSHARKVLGCDRVDSELGKLKACGLVEERPDGNLAPTHAGWLLGNELYEGLWGLSQGTIDHRVC